MSTRRDGERFFVPVDRYTCEARDDTLTQLYRSSEDEVLLTRLLEKSIRRTEAVDREALCIVAGEKVRLNVSLR